MMTPDNKEQIRLALRSLAASYSAAVTQIEESIAVICRELGLEDTILHGPPFLEETREVTPTPQVIDRPIADQLTLSVLWQGRSCFLGNTPLLFKFFERLARRPNQYVSHRQLLDDVWSGPRDAASIRGVAKRLRDKLNEAGMEDLAQAIDGSTPGYYGLILDRAK